jgi:hypothetical protein
MAIDGTFKVPLKTSAIQTPCWPAASIRDFRRSYVELLKKLAACISMVLLASAVLT